MRKTSTLVTAIILILIAVFVLAPKAYGQAATQTDHYCPEMGEVSAIRAVRWDSMWHPVQLNQTGIDLLLEIDTSDAPQAYYGDPATDIDDDWVGAPDDIETYMKFTFTTSLGKRWLWFADSVSEPDVLFGVMMLSTKVSGEGDQRGMHDICAVFMTDRETVEDAFASSLPID